MAEISTELGLQDSRSDNNDPTAAAVAAVAVVVSENGEVSTPDVSMCRGLYPRMDVATKKRKQYVRVKYIQ